MTRMEVRIERLLLEGVRHEDRAAILTGLHAELLRLLADDETARQVAKSPDRSLLRGHDIRVPAESSAQAIGIRAARAIVSGVTR
jgi:hypothetical protein